MLVLTFEERFFEHQIVNIEPSGESRVIITKANVATLLQGQELLNFFLNTARDVLINVYQAHNRGTPEGQGKVLDRPADWEASVRVLVVGLQVVHVVGDVGVGDHIMTVSCASSVRVGQARTGLNLLLIRAMRAGRLQETITASPGSRQPHNATPTTTTSSCTTFSSRRSNTSRRLLQLPAWLPTWV